MEVEREEEEIDRQTCVCVCVCICECCARVSACVFVLVYLKKRKSYFHSNVSLFDHIYNIFIFCSLLACKRLDWTLSQSVARRKRLQAKRRFKRGFIVSPCCTMVCLWRQAGRAVRKEVVEPVLSLSQAVSSIQACCLKSYKLQVTLEISGVLVIKLMLKPILEKNAWGYGLSSYNWFRKKKWK